MGIAMAVLQALLPWRLGNASVTVAVGIAASAFPRGADAGRAQAGACGLE